MEKNFDTNQSSINRNEIIQVCFKGGYIKELPFTTTAMRDECFLDMEEAMMFCVPAFSMMGTIINLEAVDYIEKGEYA